MAIEEEWIAQLDLLMERVGGHFARSESRQRARDYVSGLLSRVERKNGWQLAEVLGAATPYGIQQFLFRSPWDADAVRDEVRSYAVEHLGEEEGILEKGEGALVRNVVDTGDTIVREVMTPRTDMVALERGAGLGAARRLFVDSRHSRLPVYSGSVDRIVGVLALKDLLPHWQAADETPVSPLLRPVLHVPETRPVLDLLRDMQRRQAPLAVVVDEYGGTAGLVTIDDLVAEIVGELPEEHGASEADVVEESPGVWVVSGDTHVDEVRGWLPALIESGDFDTVGGWVSALLGRVPETGERFEHNGLRLEVLAADGRRVRKVRLHGSAASRREEHA